MLGIKALLHGIPGKPDATIEYKTEKFQDIIKLRIVIHYPSKDEWGDIASIRSALEYKFSHAEEGIHHYKLIK